ncbi:hypothetical protein DFH09DRAFT_1374830 [Mycena vulgaris]|nr:hypothetical protein DFH09DRAFT_1374830 [Mycena vulgaris]
MPASLSGVKVHGARRKPLGKPEPLAGPDTFVSCEYACPNLVKFSSKYRPLEILQANGIAPLPSRKERNPSVDSERAPTPDDELEEARILRARLKALEAKLVKEKGKKPRVKRELADEAGTVIDSTQDPPPKRVKQELKRAFISGEIIDLT